MTERQDLAKFKKFCDSGFGKAVMQKEAEFIAKELEGCQKVLDAGCGIGALEKLLPDELEITAVDISELFLQEAKIRNSEKKNRTFVHGDITRLDSGVFKDNSFDAVFSVATIEFLKDYQVAFKEIRRVLKRNGKVVLMILNPQSAYFQEHVMQRGSYFQGMRHRNLERIRSDCLHFLKMPRYQYFLGIRGQEIFETDSPDWAALYVITGEKI